MNKKITISLVVIIVIILLVILIKPRASIAPVLNIAPTNNPLTPTSTPTSTTQITPSPSIQAKISPNVKSSPTTLPKTTYTLSEVAQHNNAKDCWIAINRKVYNATDFIASGQHNDKILNGCGIDASALFAKVDKHTGSKAQAQLSRQLIGTLK